MDAGTAAVQRVGGGAPESTPAPPSASRADTAVLVGLAALGAACAATTFFRGLYDTTDWWPVAVVALAGALAAVVAVRPLVPTRPAAVAFGAFVALAAWALLSALWAESVDQALIAGARWAMYAAVFVVFVAVLRGERRGRAVLPGATAAILVVGVYVVIRLQAGDAASLLVAGRLNDPMGYVNGEAALFLMGFWPLLAVAERSRRALTAGAAAGGAAFLAGLMMLSQSRGVVLGLVASVVVVLAFVPGRLRRVMLLGLIVVLVAGLGGPLRHVYASSGGGDHAPAAGALHDGGLWVLVIGLVAAILWGFARAALDALAPDGSGGRATARSVVAGVVVVAAIAVIGLGVVKAGSIEHTVSKQYHAFVDLSGEGSGQRLVSGGGYRYDFWRIALKEFGAHPLEGVGAGNYAADYFANRRSDQPITQPHSLPLQVLSDLGVVGGLLFLAFVGALAVGLWRLSRAASRGVARTDLCVAAGGIVVAFLVQSFVDWVALIPALVGIFLAAAAALVGWTFDRTRSGRSGALRWVAVGAAALFVGYAAFTAGRVGLAESARGDAIALLNRDPAAALAKAQDALDLNGDSLPARFTEAAALARLHRYDAARAVLLDGARLQPHNYAPWALLGDLALAHGDLRAARDAYRRALALNPRDPVLQRLARNPRS